MPLTPPLKGIRLKQKNGALHRKINATAYMLQIWNIEYQNKCCYQIQLAFSCFSGWEPFRLRGCLSTVPGIHLTCSWDGNEGGGGGQGGLQWLCLHGLFSRAQQAAWWTSRAAQERSGVSQWISVRVPRRGFSGVRCPSGEKWSRQACSPRGLFWRNIPLSAVLLSSFVESVKVLPCLLSAGCFSSSVISEVRTKESC